jgi:hypothetical protein
MSARNARARIESDARPPDVFQVGLHVVEVTCAAGRWSVGVDQVALSRWYESRAEAWEAGVREASRLDGAGARA